MRKILVESRYIDRQAERAARRIAIALDMPLGPDVKVAALSAIGELHIQIKDLQRQNLELRFLVDTPGFNLEKQLEKEEYYVKRCFETNVQLSSLYNRYDYEYFLEYYHPGYIYSLCKKLVSLFDDYKTDPSELWNMLILSTGYITEDMEDAFGPEECDKGII